VSPGELDPAPAQTRFPLNRVLTLLGPYLAVLAGVAASWVSRHFPGLVTNVPATTAAITQCATFVIGALITWALQHKYLDGWQRWEARIAELESDRRMLLDSAGGVARAAELGAAFAKTGAATPSGEPAAPGPFVIGPFMSFDPRLFEPTPESSSTS
jgi:hypothetical protein